MSRWICIDGVCIPSDENDWAELVAFADAIAEQEPIDIVHCQDCKYWVYNFNGCSRNPCAEPWYAEDFCSYGEREEGSSE